MDINATVTTDINTINGRGQQHSKAKKVELMKSNSCFYCKIKGHQAKDCCKKQADHGNFSGRKEPARVHTAPATPDFQDPDSLANFMKENMDSFDEDTKMSFIEKLMLQDFTGAQN